MNPPTSRDQADMNPHLKFVSPRTSALALTSLVRNVSSKSHEIEIAIEINVTLYQI